MWATLRKWSPNIHAGVKYIRFMMKQFYADEPMDNLNKGLFTFASYNAGPGRISQLRKQAAKARAHPNNGSTMSSVGCGEDRPRDGAVREQHLQVLPCYKMVIEERGDREKAKEEIKKEMGK